MEDLKLFTLEEAEALLPELTRLLNETRRTREEIQRLEVDIDLQELLQDDGASARMEALVAEYNRSVSGFYDLIEKIHAHGCFLKDVEMGLIDFYSMREGKVVYLCWKMGEDRIRFWHEVGKGFGAREVL